ncbi:shikimate dehydrogenase [Poriferisphaera sp. WC338]|uniref:shikimate dehydrogenase n=1 Tax=Poriferisphaera sp. WC338 TaxID=3425129 RepID=UPI003D81B0CD
MTKLTVPIMVQNIEHAHSYAAKAAEAGADLVEYRIDLFTEDAKAVTELVVESPLPCIVTCRPTWEGGLYDGDEDARIAFLEHACVGVRKPAYIDLELVAYERSANLRLKIKGVVDHAEQVKGIDTGLILSSHDFEGRPKDLLQRVAKMAEAELGRVIKVAWAAKSLRDNLEAFEIVQGNYKPTIALCMGEHGLASRVLAKKFGALLTFATLSDEGTAPGQPTVQAIKHVYRWDKLNEKTKVYGVIGEPVGHSLSPVIHNAGFEAVNFDGVYLPMPIEKSYESFKATVGSWIDQKDLDFKGASVTIPHKENLIRFVKEMDGEVEPLTEQIGAANTLAVRDDGSLYACNTDYAGALDAVCGGLGILRDDLAGKSIGLIGAGGVARAIIAGFGGQGCDVQIYNRTMSKGEILVEELGVYAIDRGGSIIAAGLDKLMQSDCDVYINCTPIGMLPKIDASPMEGFAFKQNMIVFDTIYNPAETKLLKDAKAAGCKTISGMDMFVNQAAPQLELWTGQAGPMDVFREALKNKR